MAVEHVVALESVVVVGTPGDDREVTDVADATTALSLMVLMFPIQLKILQAKNGKP